MSRLNCLAWWTLATCVAGGCGGSSVVRVPRDLTQQSEELAVSDRSARPDALEHESFRFGSYRVLDVERTLDSARADEIFDFERSRARGGYAFKLNAGDRRLDGTCSTEARQAPPALGRGDFEKLGCSCQDGNDETNLILEASSDALYEGAVIGSDYDYQVSVIVPGESGRELLGYRLDGPEPIGAVDVVKPGRAWLRKSVAEPQRSQLACVLAGLLLYEPALADAN